ncbi:MAG: helix-turn-helix domain-containing protein [Alphaproteobacteria bacterium]|nr:helix-turn-helix domain-containing protein [Alphaproteobacteria bacterium]
MGEAASIDMDQRIARRLRALRDDRGWSLDELARRSGVSRASLSRLENGEVSPTAQVLGRLCAAHGLTVSRLMVQAEGEFAPLLRPSAQPHWSDPETGMTRRFLSPPGQALAGEVVRCHLPAGARIAYERPPRPGLEHHLVMEEGGLAITVDGRSYDLTAGDCLRYQLFGASSFMADERTGARYLLFIV